MKRKYLFLASALSILMLTSCSFLEDIRQQIGGGDATIPTQTAPIPSIGPNNPDENLPPFDIKDPENPGIYTITYDCNNGVLAQAKVTSDKKAVQPGNPEKLASTFVGWYKDEELTHPFDFNTTIIKDTTIYAKYNIDYAELTNELSTDEIKGTVRILNTYTNGPVKVGKSLGSGTIIKEDNRYFYAITNNHVVYVPKGQTPKGYTVIDTYLNEYKAEVILARADYDLALIKFEKNPKHDYNERPIPVIKLAKDNLSIGEEIISVGNPLGQVNCITYGKCLDTSYKFVPNPETITESNVTFGVINHSSFIDSGSSGGALFDTNLHLIGVNFASSTEIASHDFMYSHAIPLNRVHEFLKIAKFDL